MFLKCLIQEIDLKNSLKHALINADNLSKSDIDTVHTQKTASTHSQTMIKLSAIILINLNNYHHLFDKN